MLTTAVSVEKTIRHELLQPPPPLLTHNLRSGAARSPAEASPSQSHRLVLKVAETKEELEACFALLHDTYVASSLMQPDPSGLRVTIYHALPGTTVLCAKYDHQVVGAISLIRESELGVPLQKVFDLTPLRRKPGHIAEASALAIHRKFRKTNGSVLFPLMKFMYEYCTACSDIRHLVIAVNPRQIELYESVFFFRRLAAQVVNNYDFVNGAPAIGATLDLKEAPEIFRRHYSSKPLHRNLHAYFIKTRLPNIQFPRHHSFTNGNPALTPELLDHFFNVRTRIFENLCERKKSLLRSIYDRPEYLSVVSSASGTADNILIRRHPRFTMKCPARIAFNTASGREEVRIEVIDVSRYGFKAHSQEVLSVNTWCDATIQLSRAIISRCRVRILRECRNGASGYYAFRLDDPDLRWRTFVSSQYRSRTFNEFEA